jgi:hypothetical protein
MQFLYRSDVIPGTFPGAFPSAHLIQSYSRFRSISAADLHYMDVSGQIKTEPVGAVCITNAKSITNEDVAAIFTV